jgi:hypothetical protein
MQSNLQRWFIASYHAPHRARRRYAHSASPHIQGAAIMLANRLLPLLLLSTLALPSIAQAQYRYTTERLVTGMTGRSDYESSGATVIGNDGTVGGRYYIPETWFDQAYL